MYNYLGKTELWSEPYLRTEQWEKDKPSERISFELRPIRPKQCEQSHGRIALGRVSPCCQC